MRAASKTRTRLVVALSVVIFLVAAAGVVGLVRPGPVDRWLGAAPTTSPTPAPTTPEASPTPVLVAAAGGGTALTGDGVTRAIDPLVKSAGLGSKVHVAVLDVASDEVLYARNADTMTTPASTTKLLTAAAILDARGPSYRLSTRAVAGGQPGEVVLIGGGDPTLATAKNTLFPGAARLDLLAAQVKKALGTARPTRLLYDTSLFSGPETARGWDSSDIAYGQVSRIQALMVNAGRVRPIHNEFGGDPRSSNPADAAARAFAKMLGVPSSAVKKGKAPAGGRQLGIVQSPPMVQLTDWMLEQSDNTAAEALGRQVAIADGKAGTFDNATDAIIARMRALGLPADEANLYDASGLSRNNGISPTMLTELLAYAASGQQPALSSIFGGLPVAGWSGTMTKRFVKPAPNQVGQGVVRAKTGTLSGVNTMAGVLTTADGRLLVFAIMASGSGNAVTGRAALDRVAARLVGCGCS
ncbi:D-alanyl-D-alanine carboxypeptidase/D-alanyl-D-alanine endopeptidase [Paractinoplanes abujensis]